MSKYNLTLQQDCCAESPREWSNLGTFIMQHNRYEFGDCIFKTNNNNISLKEDFKYHLKEVENCSINDTIYLPVYMYDHSGVTISTTPFNCNWDSGQIGYIYTTKKSVRNEYNTKRISNKLKNTVISVLEAEINLLNDYIDGNVYCYTLYENNEIIDSCCGFYGDDFREQMKEYLPKAVHKQLYETEISYE